MNNINTCRSSSPAPRTTWCCWSACGTAPATPPWASTTTCAIWWGDCGPSGPTCTSTSAATAAWACPGCTTSASELRLSYTFGIGMNSRLRDLSDDLLKEAVAEYERTGQPQRLFLAGRVSGRGAGPVAQPVVIKVEAHAQGTNRRAVVTNRPGWRVLPAAVYDEYADAGREREPEQGAEDASCTPAASATTGSWRTSSGSTCTRPR